MITDFGNTFIHLRRAALVGTVFAIVAAVIFVSNAHADYRITTHWPHFVFVPLCIGGMIPLVVAVTCLFAIRVDEMHITHLFCKRFILSRQPLAELERVELGGAFAVVFRFCGGAAIHFIGAHFSVIRALRERIHELRPDLARSTRPRRSWS